MKRVMAVAVAALLAGCAEEPVAAPPSVAPEKSVAPRPQPATLQEVSSPAGDGAAEPFLSTTRDGGVLLSWLEPVAGSDRVALRFARHTNGKWSDARTIVERNDLFVNWADFPSIIEDAQGTLFAHWLQKSAGGTYTYDVRMAISRDGGATWGDSFLLNRDGTKSEHGFVTLAALPAGGVGATWLDGRNMSSGHGHDAEGDMTIRYANVDANGAISDDSALDQRTCECCTTGMAMTASGPAIVYRDRSKEEIRDISVVRRNGSGWSKPRPVRNDGWKITGCPVNGPQIDARGDRAVTAWFTAANDQQRVYAAFSHDGGATFNEAVAVDEGKPVGRVDVIMLDDRTALVTWLEQTAAGAELRARRITDGTKPEASLKIADASSARAAGFTRITRVNDEVWFTWTEQNKTAKRIHVARSRM